VVGVAVVLCFSRATQLSCRDEESEKKCAERKYTLVAANANTIPVIAIYVNINARDSSLEGGGDSALTEGFNKWKFSDLGRDGCRCCVVSKKKS
jgi:hypothetical protein